MKKLLVVLGIFGMMLMAEGAFAEIPSFSVSNVTLPAGGTAVGIDDFNQDGELDFVVSCLDENAYLFVNNGDNTLAPWIQIGSGITGYINDIATGDFNGDAWPDFAVSDYSSTIHIFLNDHDNTFQQLTSVTSDNYLWGLDAGDFNGDGILDLVAARYMSPSAFNVLIGDGTGAFPTTHHFVITPDCPNPNNMGVSAIAGDFNDDGHLDVIVGQDDDCDPGAGWLYLGDGDLNFDYDGEAYDTNPINESGLSYPGAGNGDAYDINGDRHLDIFSGKGTTTGTPLLYFEGDGTGFYGLSEYIAATNLRGFRGSAPPLGWACGGVLCAAVNTNSSEVYLVDFGEICCPAEICTAFLTPKRLAIHHPYLTLEKTAPRDLDTRNWDRHAFMIHLLPCEPMDVSVGDEAVVFVDVDANGMFDDDEQYEAVVSSTDLDCSASDIAIKVFAWEDLVDNDPLVGIYSVNEIPIVDADGNDIDYLQLDTFTPGRPGTPTDKDLVPSAFTLHQNYPNPFNPVTEIRFSIPEASAVRLEVYNILGEKITTLVDRRLEAGDYAVPWDSRDSRGLTVASGIYFYRITVDTWVQTRKMVLLQ